MLGTPGTRRGRDDRGLPALSHSQSCQSWPLPSGRGQPAPAPAGQPRTDTTCAVGTRVPGARAAASGSRRVDRHHRMWPLTRLNERIDTGKTGQQKLLCQHRALSARQNGPKSPLKGPPGQGTSCGRLDLRLWGPTSFLLTNFWLFTSRTIHSLPQSPWW